MHLGSVSKNSFEWKKNASKFDEDFTENYDEDSNKGSTCENW